MKFKTILKKVWLPALTVLAICVGAVILNSVIQTSETQQLEQTVTSPPLHHIGGGDPIRTG